MKKVLPDIKENIPMPEKKEKTVHLHIEGGFHSKRW
jgi:hypothetical protein